MDQVIAEISSEPLGADIEIDGNFVGSTPSSLGIGVGEHTLRISKKGYKQWERTLKSSTGNITITAMMESMPAASAETAHAPNEPHQEASSSLENRSPPSITSRKVSEDDNSALSDSEAPANSPATPPEEALLGVRFTGNPTVRHDGVEIFGVQPGGPADSIDIKPGDVILAIDDHYLFTIDGVRVELLRHESGARLRIRYRRYSLISENYLTVAARQRK
jgi:hypothetical protein